MPENNSIYMTDQDFHRLSTLVAESSSEHVEALEQELGRAHLLPQSEIPRDVVTMNSKIQFFDHSTQKESIISLVYPQDANLSENKVSILAPLGMALIGLRVGQSIEWRMPRGEPKKLTVNAVLYQPEAVGHFNL